MWINSGETHISGGGSAGGYGYHKSSAASQAALDDAGIVLTAPDSVTTAKSTHIDGCGDNAMREALSAIAMALSAGSVGIVESHA